jgi:hypothetical protein
LKKSTVAVGGVLIVVGLLLMVLMQGSYEIKTESISIEKKNGYYAYLNKMKTGEAFSAEWTCAQPKGELRAVLITESWYNKWMSGQDIPKSELLADAHGHQGKANYNVQADGNYYLLLLPEPSTASWPFGVTVKLESRSGGGAGWLLGLAVMVGGVVAIIVGFVMKDVSKPVVPSPPQLQHPRPAAAGQEYCVNCGTLLPPGATFCPKCGASRQTT